MQCEKFDCSQRKIVLISECVTTTEGRQARLWNSFVPHNQVLKYFFPYFEILFFYYLKLCIAKIFQVLKFKLTTNSLFLCLFLVRTNSIDSERFLTSFMFLLFFGVVFFWEILYFYNFCFCNFLYPIKKGVKPELKHGVNKGVISIFRAISFRCL